MPDIVDPRLLATLSDAFPKTARIEDAVGVQDDYGEPIGTWASGDDALITDDGAFLVDDAGELLAAGDGAADTIACALYGGGGREVRRADQTLAVATHRVILAGYRPDLTPAHRLVIAGVTYNILAVVQDKARLATRAFLEVVT